MLSQIISSDIFKDFSIIKSNVLKDVELITDESSLNDYQQESVEPNVGLVSNEIVVQTNTLQKVLSLFFI